MKAKILIRAGLLGLTACHQISSRPTPLRDKLSIVTVQAEPSTGGTVTAGYTLHKQGKIITLGATPFAGWVFRHWQDGDTNANRYVKVPERKTHFIATFEIVTNAPSAPGKPDKPEKPDKPGRPDK